MARKDWNTEIDALRARAADMLARVRDEVSGDERTKIGNLASNLRKRADELEARRDAYSMRSLRAARR